MEEVVRKVPVEFFCLDGKLKDPNAEFFVRQKYNSVADDIHFSTLCPKDISTETPCPCRDSEIPIFKIGSFVGKAGTQSDQPRNTFGNRHLHCLVVRE